MLRSAGAMFADQHRSLFRRQPWECRSSCRRPSWRCRATSWRSGRLV